MKKILFYCVVHSMKICFILCILIAFLASFNADNFLEGRSWFIKFLGLTAVLVGTRFLFGGWNAYSLKGMAWSCILSTIAGVGLAIIGMNSDGGTVSFWISILPIIIGAVSGVLSARWVEQVLDDNTEIDVDAIIDNVFDIGLKNTWYSFLGEMEGNLFWAYSKGVAIYSNLCILTGLIIFIICK